MSDSSAKSQTGNMEQLPTDDCDKYDNLHNFLLETGRTPKRPPIPWHSLTVPDHLKNRPNPWEMAAAAVKPRPVTDAPIRHSKKKTKPAIDKEKVQTYEQYFSLRDLLPKK